ncbi:MAG: hypothetical protein V4515_12215 [Chloroflexota bacterium]
MTDRKKLAALLTAHEPGTDYGYEYMVCTCGWKDADGLGLRMIDPESKTWPEHILRLIAEGVSLRSEPREIERERALAEAVPSLDEELRALSEAATPGPWPIEYVEWAVRHIVRNVDRPDWEGFPNFGWTYHDPCFEEVTHPDARFIVAAVNYVRDRLAREEPTDD